MVDEPTPLRQAWLRQVEDKLDQVVDLLHEMRADGSADAPEVAAEVQARLDALAARLDRRNRLSD